MENYSVAILDDNRQELDEIADSIEKILQKNEVVYTINKFVTGKDFLCAVKYTPDRYDLVVVDAFADGKEDIEIARRLRENKVQSSLIITAQDTELALQGYEVAAYRYLIKPINYDVLEKSVMALYNKRVMKRDIIFRVGAEIRRVRPDDIYYIKTRGRGVLIKLADEMFEVPQKMDEIESLLHHTVLHRCHQSWMVNTARAVSVRRYEVEVPECEPIPVSKKYYNQLKDVLLTRWI